MTIQETVTGIVQHLSDIISQYIPGVPPEVVRYAGAGALAAIAVVLLVFALRMLFSKKTNTPSRRVNIPRTLQREGTAIDLLNSSAEDDVAIRCVVTAASSGKIKCEIIERLDVIRIKEGQEAICMFAPMKTDNGKVNSFTAKLVETDTTGRKADRIVLSAPSAYSLAPRRKHSRKRVADQQFIRVKLWVDNPLTSDIPFEDAAPHIGVNSFSNEGSDQTANAVINISSGGIGLAVQNRVIPETCAVGAPVAINIFMFNFKEKTFKPYWYAGEIRSMEEGRPDFTRFGIEFTGNGIPSDEAGTIRWHGF